MSTSTDTVASEGGWRERLWARGALAAVLGVAANVVLVALANAAGVDPDLRALTFPPVVFFSAVGALGATVVYAVLVRRVDEPARRFRQIAIGVLVVSFVPDIGLLVADETATPTGVAVLILMHVTVAAACLWLLPQGER
jgi:uncharacterized membrane protein